MSCPPIAPHCSFTTGGRDILATHTESYVIAFDAETGKMLWAHPHKNQYLVHPNTPIYHEGRLFYFSGYGSGGGMLKLSPDGRSVSLEWRTTALDSRIGGAVLVDGYLYGSGDKNREWRCFDWVTGKETYSSKEVGKGVVLAADGKLYCYSERGELALVKADPSGFVVSGLTRIDFGSEQHWAHPMIENGVLYVRHGNAMGAYKVR
ncbi:MAG: hypothetical protein R2751_15225 [Bacteroidales bacterium]